MPVTLFWRRQAHNVAGHAAFWHPLPVLVTHPCWSGNPNCAGHSPSAGKDRPCFGADKHPCWHQPPARHFYRPLHGTHGGVTDGPAVDKQ
ncbi:hypothetical protein Nepgr_017128 [Nepenthes gracilis]|uniref:Uncharacterized protein n=1 Tax=Nepenthes gracilis TaxID=150966 RepID=A0AAD3SRU1_NEPGR|nr:hypothetical protein Nepgr_017128 [Nepenthes gracilis]